MNGVGGGAYLALVVLCVVIAALWILLPFAVFGMKDLLRDVLKEQRRTNELLHKMLPPGSEPKPPPPFV